MKKRLKPFSLLAVIIVSMFAFASAAMFSPAKATYVEGYILQDTLWTLVDSPFVVSKDVYVVPGVTLTVEPGVEVRFGGNFSIVVQGKLYAVGTENKTITFTSNKIQPAAEDWISIEFSNSSQSTLAYTTINYATNGIKLENSVVEISNSKISNSSQHGIVAWNSTLNVHDNEIYENSESGIHLVNNNTAAIQNNLISTNKDGILLNGFTPHTVNITQNRIQSNAYSGVNVNVTDFTGFSIWNNTVSANQYGFYVHGLSSTTISNNSISFNKVGVYYVENTHLAEWNDIYGNELGMDVSSDPRITVFVDAEYNYWGDETGPHHASLNPDGKGNPITADGRELDFIPWLSAPVGYINQRPVARLLSDKVVVAPSQKVMFFATTSSDDKRVDKYYFNFGDGTTSLWTTLTVFEHTYSSAGAFQASLTVMDDFGVTNTNSATIGITVQALPTLEAALTLSRPDIYSGGQVNVTVRAHIGTTPISNANVTLFSIVGGSFSPKSALTNSTGYVTTMFTAPNATELIDVRIVARASRSDYADGSNFEYLHVLPRLSVVVQADPTTTRSEESAYVVVHVTINATPVPDVRVSVSATAGSFFEATGYTDVSGDVAFNFTAPKTSTQTSVTIIAAATKERYFENQGTTTITVNPRVLTVTITRPVVMESKITSDIIILVTDGSAPIAGANVTISSDLGGTFTQASGTTNQNGTCVLSFTAPDVTDEVDITLTVSAAKTGYDNGQNRAVITILPPPSAGEGLPWLTILLILIPVIAVVVVAVLIKTGRLAISREESED